MIVHTIKNDLTEMTDKYANTKIYIHNVGRSNNIAVIDEDPNMLNVKFAHISDSNNSVEFELLSAKFDSLDNFAFRLFNNVEVFKSVFNRSMAIGTDGIYPKFLKLIISIILPYTTRTFNIIQSSSYPGIWKFAKILPILKKFKRSTSEYRSIALQTFLVKVFEKLISIQIIDHINKNNLIIMQSGFRKS